jgi:hypothetical protein
MESTENIIKLYSNTATVILQRGAETILCTEGYEPWNATETADELVAEHNLGKGVFLYIYEEGKFCLTIVEVQDVQDSTADS